MEIPKSFREPSPGCLEVRSGGGCLAIFGLPFLAAGCFVTLIGLGVVHLENESEVPTWGWPLMVLMGLVFVGAGGALVFGRGTIRFDASRGTVSKQWRLIVPIKNEENLLAEFSDVVIAYTPGDSDSSERYPVRLWSESTGKQLDVTSPTEYSVAFGDARFLGEYLRLPIRDRSSDQEIVLPAGAQPGSHRDRVHVGIVTAESVARPSTMRSEIDESGGSLRISIPGPPSGRWVAIRFALPLIVFLVAAYEVLPFFRRTNTPEGVQWVFIGFLALFLLIPAAGAVLSAVRAIRAKTVVSVSSDEIVLEETGAWRTRSRTVLAESIIAITCGTRQSAMAAAGRSASQRRGGAGGATSPASMEPPGWLRFLGRLVPSKGVVIKSTAGVFSFGQGLPDDEVRYLHWIVARRFSAPPV